ncbi:MAG: tetratricopeptide repeat protein [Planctomycetia bacterium]|nr:tetratricopeptide repeat protein [Planctomycetia bacterium]
MLLPSRHLPLQFRHPCWAAIGVLLAIAAARPVCGAENQLAFLHALQDRGYGEVAVYYLTSLRDGGKLNDDLKASFDVEMAASLCVAAREAKEPAEAHRKFSEAESLLEEFLKRDSKGLAAARALKSCGHIEFERGGTALEALGGTNREDWPEAAGRNARAAFERCRSCYDRALAIYNPWLEKVPGEPAPLAVPSETSGASAAPAARESAVAKERRETEEAALDCRFESALAEYNIARTYPAGEDPNRQKALTNAAQAFDAIFQRNRTRRSGLYAHFWYGRAMEELGDGETALDAYDEVLASAPDEGGPRPEPLLESLYAETEYRRLLILARQDLLKDVAAEAAQWTVANASARPTDGYQGVHLEQAKALILIATKTRDKKVMQEAMQEAITILADIATVPSAHQREAILLRRRHGGEAGTIGLDNFNDAVAVGDASAGCGLWDEAVSAYARAVELGKETPDADSVLTARYRLARAHYNGGHADAALEVAETLARSHPDRAIAPTAAALAMRAASALSATAADKTAARERLTRLVEFVARQWPDRPEADEARLILGTAALTQSDYEGAAKVFEAIPPTALCYGNARYLAAQAHWQRYLDEKRKPAEKRRADVLSAERLQTIAILTAATAPTSASSAAAAGSQANVRMRIFLAEVYLEEGKKDQALLLLNPLTNKAENLSTDLASRALGVVLKTHLAANDVESAGKAALRLGEIGEDSPQVNAVLAEFLGRVASEWKQAAMASVSPTETSAKAASLKQLTTALVTRLAARRNHAISGQVILADVCLDLGKTAEAQGYYQDIVSKANENPALSQANAYAVARARTMLIDVLRAKKQYAEALREADRVIKENPRSFDALLQKGLVLQAWAQSDPKRYDEALAVWTQLRVAIMPLPQKPPEYYEIVYNAAYCLVAQAAKSDDKHQLAEARRLLKSALVLNPQLSGPETVAKYNALLEKCRFLEAHQL